MKSLVKIGLATILVINLLSIAYADSKIELEAVEVVGQKFKEKDKAYMKSGAVSIRDEIAKSGKDLDAVIRSAPGTFTQMNKAAGAVTVNIRGGTGFGRVNTMVDGVTQTLYSSGGDTGGKAGAGSQFGAAIDPAFLTSVEINRGSFKGAGGANSLMGSANFKTIGVDDILRFDRNIGGMIKYTNGDNDLKPEYVIALAGKKIFDYGGWFGILYGHSRKTITQNYYVGRGDTHKSISIPYYEIGLEDAHKYCNGVPAEDYKECVESELQAKNIIPFDPEKVKQKPQSHLFKIEYGDDYNLLELQYRKTTNHLAGRSIENDTKQVNYNFSIPDNNYINFNILYSKNKNTQNYDVGSTIIDRMIREPLKGYNNSTTFDISNTFAFNLPNEIALTMTPGLNRLTNEYSKNRYPNELRIFKICDDSTECLTSVGELSPNGEPNLYEKINASLPTNSFFPQGTSRFKTLYLNNKLEWDIFTIDYNLNLVKYKNKGQRLISIEQEYQHRFIDKFNELYELPWSPDVQNQIDQLDKELKEFDKQYEYGELYDENGNYIGDGYKKRPEFSHYSEVKNVFKNYSFMLTANISDYFTPFIGYSKTHRAPTIQEMFFSTLSDAGVNTNLNPETARTRQIGFNGFMEGVITDNDKIGYKFTRYKTTVNDFIYNVSTNKTLLGINPIFGNQQVMTIYHINHDELVTMNGFEVEFSYDMGKFFTNIAYSKQKTNQPASYSDISRTAQRVMSDQAEAQSFGLTKVTILPDRYGSVELGTRFFNNKLTLGTIAKYYGKSKRSKYNTIRVCRGGGIVYFDKDRNRPVCPGKQDTSDEIGKIAEYEEVESQPFVFDVYAVYEPTENLTFKLNVENITDEKYANPLDANNDSASQYITGIGKLSSPGKPFFVQNNFARGRTIKLSFSYKF